MIGREPPASRYGRAVGARTETQSLESSADPGVVLELLADARNLPDWAPGFADAVSGDVQAGWRVIKDGEEFAVRVAVQRDAGTVDFLREIAPGREGGAYVRVLAGAAGGSVIVMTLPVPADVDRAVVAATLSDELAALSRLAA